MAVFVLIEEDAFDRHTNGVARSTPNDFAVRRPLRGIQLGAPSYTNIRVIRKNGSRIPLANSSGKSGTSSATANFIVRQINEARQEKYQLLETFGETFGFFFGERPRVLQFSGSLVSTPDFNWHSEWWHNYEHVFRGTRLVQADARMYIQAENKVVEGYMLDANTQSVADPNPNFVSLTFSFWVTGYVDVSRVGSTQFPRPYRVARTADEHARVANMNRLLDQEGIPVTGGNISDNVDEYLVQEGREIADSLFAAEDLVDEPYKTYAWIEDEARGVISPGGSPAALPDDLSSGTEGNAVVALPDFDMGGPAPWGGMA